MSEAPHIVKSYAQELQRLRDLMTQMGGMVESQVAMATDAIVDQDPELASRVVEQDPQGDALERQAEQFVIRMLALRQPMANDLRQILAGAEDHGGDGADRRLREEHGQAQHRAGPVLAAVQPDGPQEHGAAGAGEPEAGDRRGGRERRGQGGAGVAIRPGDRRPVQLDLPRADHLHDGRRPAASRRARTCCSSPRTWSGSATTRPISPKPCTMPRPARR